MIQPEWKKKTCQKPQSQSIECRLPSEICHTKCSSPPQWNVWSRSIDGFVRTVFFPLGNWYGGFDLIYSPRKISKEQKKINFHKAIAMFVHRLVFNSWIARLCNNKTFFLAYTQLHARQITLEKKSKLLEVTLLIINMKKWIQLNEIIEVNWVWVLWHYV